MKPSDSWSLQSLAPTTSYLAQNNALIMKIEVRKDKTVEQEVGLLYILAAPLDALQPYHQQGESACFS